MNKDIIYRQDAINLVSQHTFYDDYEDTDKFCLIDGLKNLSPAQPEWNNHTVACLLADMFGDTCACNYNGIDEWLPGKCELLDSCPHPVGVACWEQFLKYKAEGRTDE